MSENKDTREIWINPDRKHEYWHNKENEWQFQLIQINGSLSSIKSYRNEKEAIEDGWRIKNVRK